jgi:hypothetical protein
MEEDEGGPVMTARVCTGTGEVTPEFLMRCGAQGSLMMRYIPVAPTDYPPNEGNYQTQMKFLDGRKLQHFRLRAECRRHERDCDAGQQAKRLLRPP